MAHALLRVHLGRRAPSLQRRRIPGRPLVASHFWQIGVAIGNAYGGWPTTGNQNPAGRMLAVDGSAVYGFGRNQYIHHGAHVGLDGATVYHFKPEQDAGRRFTHYRLFAMDEAAGMTPGAAKPSAKPGRRVPGPASKQYRWTREVPLLVRAMVLSPEAVLLAGPPDIISERPADRRTAGRGGRPAPGCR